MSIKRINVGARMSSAVVHGDTVYLAGLTADDAKADPAKIDLEITESPFGAGVKAPGIVKVEKETVTLTYAPMGGDRPAKFDDDKAFMFVLKKKADKKAKD